MNKFLFIITILYFVHIKYSLAEDFIIEFTGKAEITGLNFSDKSSYKLYTSEGYWKSSFGDYGKVTCFGDINKNKELQKYVKKNYLKFSTLIYKKDLKENYLIVCKNQTCSNKIKTIEELKSVEKNYVL